MVQKHKKILCILSLVILSSILSICLVHTNQHESNVFSQTVEKNGKEILKNNTFDILSTPAPYKTSLSKTQGQSTFFYKNQLNKSFFKSNYHLEFLLKGVYYTFKRSDKILNIYGIKLVYPFHCHW